MPSIRQSIRSSTASKRPTSAIADGQIALNTASGTPGIFFKDSANNIIKAGPAHYGATAPNSSPAVGGSTGNSIGEAWLDTSLTPNGWKIWNGSAWVNATPLSSDTVQGLVELATDAEVQAGVDIARAVTAAGLQSKVSDSVSTTSASGIASSTAVKTAYDLANAALPKAGGIITGNLEIGSTGSFTFEGSTADGFETTLAVVNPTADRTITFPNITGTVITTGDTGTVTSTMLLDGTIVDADISASAEIAVSKLADGNARQLLQTDAAGTGVEWTSDVAVPGVLTVASGVSFASSFTVSGATTLAGGLATVTAVPSGSASAPSIYFAGDTNTGIYSPGADQVGISTGGTGRVLVDASGNVGINGTPANYVGYPNLRINGSSGGILDLSNNGTSVFKLTADTTGAYYYTQNTSYPHIWGAGATERMRIDSSGNVGIGVVPVSSQGKSLQIATGVFEHEQINTNDLRTNLTSNAISVTPYSNTYKYLATGASATMLQQAAGQFRFYNAPSGTAGNAISFTQAMTLDASGRLGIGTTTPQDFLSVYPGITGGISLLDSGNTVRSRFFVDHTGGVNSTGIRTQNYWLDLDASGSSQNAIRFFTGIGNIGTGSERARIDSSGNVGIGVVPSNWNQGTNIDIGAASCIGNNSNLTQISNNRVLTSGANYYKITAAASLYSTGAGQHIWYTAPSGTAGAAISFTQAMTLDVSGRLGIGITSPSVPLQVLNAGTGNNTNNGAITLCRTGTVGSTLYHMYSTAASDEAFAFSVHGGTTFSDTTYTKYLASAGGVHIWYGTTTSAERMRIDSSGRLLVGTSSASVTCRAVFQGHQADNTASTDVYFQNGTAAASVLSGNALGTLSFAASGSRGAYITTVADANWTASSFPAHIQFATVASGSTSPTERLRITNDGVMCHDQPTPATYAAAATLTVTDLKTGIITYTGGAATLTLPTGTLTEGGFAGIYTNMTFEWSVINTGAGICTIGAGTAHTIVGSGSVAIGASARFTSRRTAANTFVSYRLS